jgi:hypothetical protein
MELDRIAIRQNRFVDVVTETPLVRWRSDVIGWTGSVLVADHEGVVVLAGGKRHDIKTGDFLRHWTPLDA